MSTKNNIISFVEVLMTDHFGNKWYDVNKTNIKSEYIEIYNEYKLIFEKAIKYIKNETDKK